MGRSTQFTNAFGDEPRLKFDIRRIVRLVLVVAGLVGDSQMNFNTRTWFGRPINVTGPQFGVDVVLDTSDSGAHYSPEEAIHEIQNRLGAAEIFRKWNDLPQFGIVLPCRAVLLENSWFGETKSENALLEVADEEQVGFAGLPREGAKDRVLRGVDILTFIHEHELEATLPLLRQWCWAGSFRSEQ